MADFAPAFIRRRDGSTKWELRVWNEDTNSYYVAREYEDEKIARFMLAIRCFGMQMAEQVIDRFS
jgi:hypothetical protein